MQIFIPFSDDFNSACILLDLSCLYDSPCPIHLFFTACKRFHSIATHPRFTKTVSNGKLMETVRQAKAGDTIVIKSGLYDVSSPLQRIFHAEIPVLLLIIALEASVKFLFTFLIETQTQSSSLLNVSIAAEPRFKIISSTLREYRAPQLCECLAILLIRQVKMFYDTLIRTSWSVHKTLSLLLKSLLLS